MVATRRITECSDNGGDGILANVSGRCVEDIPDRLMMRLRRPGA